MDFFPLSKARFFSITKINQPFGAASHELRLFCIYSSGKVSVVTK